MKINLRRAGGVLAAIFFATAWAVAGGDARSVLVLTSTNNASGNAVLVFELNTGGMPSLTWVDTLLTDGNGGASTNAGILQFAGDLGAVANYGTNNVNPLVRYDDFIAIGPTINLPAGCVKPDSVALTAEQLFVVGTNCAESLAWPSGMVDGTVVHLTDSSAAQIAVGKSWAAVTLTSGTVLQLPLNPGGALTGAQFKVTLPTDADTVPLGEAFWGDLLGFTPAHSVDSFAVVNKSRTVFPIVGPTPAYPTNAPCWVAKGAGNVWYTGNSPRHAISIFFTDGQGGVFYKSVPLGGAPSDITVSPDGKWLAVIYAAGGDGYVSVFSIDAYGDLTHFATSSGIGYATISGVAFSE